MILLLIFGLDNNHLGFLVSCWKLLVTGCCESVFLCTPIEILIDYSSISYRNTVLPSHIFPFVYLGNSPHQLRKITPPFPPCILRGFQSQILDSSNMQGRCPSVCFVSPTLPPVSFLPLSVFAYHTTFMHLALFFFMLPVYISLMDTNRLDWRICWY